MIELAEFETSDAFNEVEKSVLRLAVEMTRTPADVSDATFAALRRHFEPPQLVELVASIAWESWRGRFNRAFGVGAEGFSGGAFCPMPVRAPASHEPH